MLWACAYEIRAIAGPNAGDAIKQMSIAAAVFAESDSELDLGECRPWALGGGVLFMLC